MYFITIKMYNTQCDQVNFHYEEIIDFQGKLQTISNYFIDRSRDALTHCNNNP